MTRMPARASFEFTPEQRERAEKRRLDAQAIEERHRDAEVESRLQSIQRAVGARYAGCSLDSFEISGNDREATKQKAVLGRVREYCRDVVAKIEGGGNLVILGDKGTGKDHLLSVLMFAAVRAGKTVLFKSGVDLWAEIRDSISGEKSERQWLSDMLSPDVLAISDPLPPVGSLSEFQSSNLFRLVDARYRALKPIWITTNSGGEDMEKRAGSQAVDRIRDGALALNCEWASYRKAVR